MDQITIEQSLTIAPQISHDNINSEIDIESNKNVHNAQRITTDQISTNGNYASQTSSLSTCEGVMQDNANNVNTYEL